MRKEHGHMSLDLLFKIAGVGILISVFHTALKQAGKEDMAHLCTLAGFTIVLVWVVQLLGQLFTTVQSVFKLY
jgi:stage III sporulation protein AC